MMDLKAEVYSALTRALPGTNISYAYPQAETQDIVFPCVSYYEIENRVHTRVDGREALSEIAFMIDIFGKTDGENVKLAKLIDAELSQMGFSRQFTQSLFEPDTHLHHKSMRYRTVVDGDKNAGQ